MSVSLWSQRTPSSISSGRAQSARPSTNADSIQRPPLATQYFEINRLGYLERSSDTIAARPLFTDLQNQDIHHLRLGNAYSATMRSDLDRQPDPGIYMGLRSYQVYDQYFHPDQIASPNRPVAIAEYGTRFGDGLSNIGIQFNRTFARRITFGFNVFSGKSVGQYQHQESTHNRLDFNILQSSKGGKRNSYAHFGVYRNKDEMNGGLVDPTSVNTPVVGGNINRSVNITDGELKLKYTNFKIGTSVKIGIDSIPKQIDKKVFAELGSRAERFNFLESNITDGDITLYSPLMLSTGSLDANMYNRNYYLKSGIQFKGRSATATGSIHLLSNQLRRDSLGDESTIQTFAKIHATYKIKDHSSIHLRAYQSVTGRKESLASAQLKHRIADHRFSFSVLFGSDAPNVVQNKLALNGVAQWANDFVNEKQLKAAFNYENPRWNTNIDLSYTRITDLIYLTRFASYGQTSDPYSIYRASIRQKLTFFGITLDNQLLIQSVSDDQVLPLPQLSSRHDLSTRLSFFKKRLNTRFGCVVWLQDATPLPSFHPIINDFYFPGNTQMNQYIRVLPYLRAIIDTFEIYVAADDIINQAFNRHHFSVEGYPELDSRINLGFRWMFLD